MANTLLTPSWTLKEVGRNYENSLKFIANVERKYSSEYVQAGAKVGNTINYRLPQRWQVSDGQALDVQNILDQTVPISLTNQKHVDMAWSAWQETTEVEDVQERYIKTASDALASVVDGLAFNNVFRDVWNEIGTLGTTPSTTLLYLQGNRKLTDMSSPRPGRVAVLDPEAAAVIANSTTTLFNPQAIISENYRDGMLGRGQLGIGEWYEDQNRPGFLSGEATTASTPLVNGASQTGSSLITDGWGTANLKRGDIFTAGGVFSVNRLSYISTARLQQFVLTADVSAAAGAATLSISPPIITSGPLQTVTASPADNAVVTYWSMAPGGTFAATASPTGMIFHPEAFAFVTADLAMPGGGAKASRIQSKARGVALRMAEQWDVQSDQNITRIDTIVGAATLRAEWACRVQG